VELTHCLCNTQSKFKTTSPEETEKSSSSSGRYVILLYWHHSPGFRVCCRCLAHWSNCRSVWSTWTHTKTRTRILFGGSNFTNKSYESFCHKLHISPLPARWEDLATRFFNTLLDPASCLHYIIPKKRDNSQITKLRKPAVYEVTFARTDKFSNSFVLYALNNYV